MKVAIIYDLTEPGGVQTCVLSLIKGLNKKGIKPVIFWDEAPNNELLEEAGVTVEYVKLKFPIAPSWIKTMPNLFRYLLWPFNMVRISKIPLDFDHVYSFTVNILIDQNRSHLFYLSGPPLLPQLESKSIRFKMAKFLYKMLIRPFYPAYEPQVDGNYVINSKFTAQLFEEAHQRTLEVVYPSNQLKIENLQKEDLSFRDTVTFFSRIVDYKRPEFLINLAGQYPDLKFVIMGGVSKNRIDYLESLKHMASDQNLSNLSFYPNASRNDIDQILKKTLFYVFPAINEHFGITTVEAVLKGCIPFVHDSGGQKEIVPFDLLRFSDRDFTDKFAELLSLKNKDLNQLRQDMHEHILLFTEDAFIDRMINICIDEKQIAV
ncbi:glycosyltransferase [Ancylomarina euxinus]|uniref:Glycosyltransferase n=1 Tax=Ancylomarina euxinus TaxID=2283627 RepID=A0A425Y6Z3_9BACT|nr:glycosyltransferase family 4 protein [Ancylomarina euxinus]MCZ4694009.1 glycosyltransferase family 4 protein [Ancylomarina euxinus]MUP14571.1 glycosyltransferase [Ancylomarina euxinus]RRG24120.1 glycosyltransferase [Ancylomarina euxinus]